MKCPKCSTELHKIDVDIMYGWKIELELLAEGELRIYACEGCKVAILADRPREAPEIITPEQKIIIPT